MMSTYWRYHGRYCINSIYYDLATLLFFSPVKFSNCRLQISQPLKKVSEYAGKCSLKISHALIKVTTFPSAKKSPLHIPASHHSTSISRSTLNSFHIFSTFHAQLSSVLAQPMKSISSWSSVLGTAISDDFQYLATSQVRRKRWLAYLPAVGYETDAILLLYAWYTYGLRGIYLFSQYQTFCECWIPEGQDSKVQILQRLDVRFPLSLLPVSQNLLSKEPFSCQFYTLHLSSNLSFIQKTLSPLIIFQAPSPVTLSTIAVSPIYYIWPKHPRHISDDRKLGDNLWIPGAEEEAHNTQFPFQTITQQSQLRIDSTPNFLYRTPVQQIRSACCGRPRDVCLVLSCREWSQKLFGQDSLNERRWLRLGSPGLCRQACESPGYCERGRQCYKAEMYLTAILPFVECSEVKGIDDSGGPSHYYME